MPSGHGVKGSAGQGNGIGAELATVGANGVPHHKPRAVDQAIIVPKYLDSSTNG